MKVEAAESSPGNLEVTGGVYRTRKRRDAAGRHETGLIYPMRCVIRSWLNPTFETTLHCAVLLINYDTVNTCECFVVLGEDNHETG